VYQFVAMTSGYLFVPAQQFSESLVVPDDPVVLIDDENRVMDGIEGLFPLLLSLYDLPLCPFCAPLYRG